VREGTGEESGGRWGGGGPTMKNKFRQWAAQKLKKLWAA